MKSTRNIHWPEKWRKNELPIVKMRKTMNGKGKRCLFCEASNVLFDKYKIKATYYMHE